MDKPLLFYTGPFHPRTLSPEEQAALDNAIAQWREEFRKLKAEMQCITPEDLQIRIK